MRLAHAARVRNTSNVVGKFDRNSACCFSLSSNLHGCQTEAVGMLNFISFIREQLYLIH